MKIDKLFFLLLFTISTVACGQDKEMPGIDGSHMYSMQDALVKYDNGQKYFLKGSDKPFTGFLYARYDNGQLESVQQFENGVGNGIWVNYDPEGRKEFEGTYRNNRVEGPVTFYYENGRVKSEGHYRDFKRPIGWWTFYDRNGNMVSKRNYTR